MKEILELNIKGFELLLSVNTTNALGRVIRLSAINENGERIVARMHFTTDENNKLGSQNSDDAYVVFFPRSEYSDYVIMLSQAKASHLRIVVDRADRNNITAFAIGDVPIQSKGAADVLGPD